MDSHILVHIAANLKAKRWHNRSFFKYSTEGWGSERQGLAFLRKDIKEEDLGNSTLSFIPLQDEEK